MPLPWQTSSDCVLVCSDRGTEAVVRLHGDTVRSGADDIHYEVWVAVEIDLSRWQLLTDYDAKCTATHNAVSTGWLKKTRWFQTPIFIEVLHWHSWTRNSMKKLQHKCARLHAHGWPRHTQVSWKFRGVGLSCSYFLAGQMKSYCCIILF
jgi:hypothetical protein